MYGQTITDFNQLTQIEKDESLRRMARDFSQSDREIKRIDAMTRERPRLQEAIFFNVFLPYFAGVREEVHYFKDDEYVTAHEKAMMAWQHVLNHSQRPENQALNTRAVASWIYSEVDIINDQGEVVVTVPPLLRFEHIDTLHKNPERKDIYAIVARSNIANRISSRHGDLTLRNGLTEAVSGLVNDNAITDNLKAWNVVFRHYGYPEIPLSAAPDASSPSVPGAAAPDASHAPQSSTYNLDDLE